MMKKITSIILAISLTVLCGMTAFAAPKVMPDGQIFDPEFYAVTYPEINAVAQNNEALLYNHWIQCGKELGYLPYAGYVAEVGAQTQLGVSTDASTIDQTPVQQTQSVKAGVAAVPTPGMTVYLPKSGKKYHSISNCGNMDAAKAEPVTIEYAKAKEIPQCTKCFR